MTRSRRNAVLGVLLALLAGAVAAWRLRGSQPGAGDADDASPRAPADSPPLPASEPKLAAAPAAPTDSAGGRPSASAGVSDPSGARIEGTVRTREGRPVGSVVVRLLPSPADLASRERTVTARDDGTFRFDDPPLGPARVFVRGGGWVTAGLGDAEAVRPDPLVVVVERERVSRVSLTVVPSARAEGIVVDPTSKPVAGATVRAFVRDTAAGSPGHGFLESSDERLARPVAAVETDAEGRFSLDGLVGGASYDVAATHPSFLPAHVGPVVASDTEPRVLTLALRQGRSIDVTVLADDGKPVEGARIWASPVGAEPERWAQVATVLAWLSPPPVRDETDAAGRVRIGPLEPAPVRVSVRADGFLDDRKEFAASEVDRLESARSGQRPKETVVALGTDAVELRLRRGLSISGRVVDEHGAPVAAVSVQAQIRRVFANGYSLHGFDAVWTDAEGRFQLDGMPEGSLTLEAKTGKPLRETTKEVEAGARDVTIVLGADAAAGLEIVILDPDGRPVPRATVRGRWHSYEARDGRHELDMELSFGNNTAAIDVTDPRDDRGRALPLAGSRVLFRRGGPRVATVRLEPEAPVVGRVVGPDGAGVAGVIVTAVVSDDERDGLYGLFGSVKREGPVTPAAGRTDEAGSFRIGGLPARPYRLHVDAPAPYLATPAVEVRAGGPPALIRLRRGVIATVTVLDFRGEPVAEAYVRSTPVDSDPVAEVAAAGDGSREGGATSRDGTRRLGPFDPNVARRLEVRPPDGRPELRSYTAGPSSPRDETLRLERGGFLRGVVNDKKGVPVARALVTSTVDGVRGPVASTDEAGKFELRELTEGSVRLVASLGGVYGEIQPAGPEVVAAVGREDVVLVVDRGVELSVRVENLPKGVVDLEAMLVPEGDAGAKFLHEARLEDGRLRFTGLRADARYGLLVLPCSEAPDDSLWQPGVRGDAGEVAVRLVRGRTVTGRLVAPPGAEEFSVGVLFGSGELSGEVEDDGRFVIRGVPAGAARIQGSGRDRDHHELSGETTTTAPEVELPLAAVAAPR